MKDQTKFDRFYEKLFWLMLTGIASTGVKFMSDLSQTAQQTQNTASLLTAEVTTLNDKMSFIVNRVTKHDDEIRETKERIKLLEVERKKARR